jgi:hypothetical protein
VPLQVRRRFALLEGFPERLLAASARMRPSGANHSPTLSRAFSYSRITSNFDG